MRQRVETIAISVNTNDLNRINNLLCQLTDNKAKALTLQEIEAVLAQKDFFLYLIKDISTEEGRIIGMASIYCVKTLMGCKGYIEDVVVDEGYRGHGLGEALTEGLIQIAKGMGARYIDLTSSPERVAANEMYKKLGFEKRETNVYRLGMA